MNDSLKFSPDSSWAPGFKDVGANASFFAARFLRGEGADHLGRALQDVLSFDDDQWDWHHDFIQWLFPNPGANLMNPWAPELTLADFEALRADSALKEGVLAGWRRMLAFLGIRIADKGDLELADNFAERAVDWLWLPSHSDLRITRMLLCLRLLGLHEEAQLTLFTLLELLPRRKEDSVELTTSFWTQAVFPDEAQS